MTILDEPATTIQASTPDAAELELQEDDEVEEDDDDTLEDDETE